MLRRQLLRFRISISYQHRYRLLRQSKRDFELVKETHSTASSDSDVTSGNRGGGVSGQMPPNNHHSELECSSQSMDCWRGSVHHALAVVEQHEEEMTTLFDELHELEGDLSSINDRVTRSLHQCRSRSSLSSLPGDLQPGRLQRLPPPRRRCCFGSCLDIHSFTEEQMASIVHRLLTRICELSLGRQEGRQDVPLIV